MAVLPIRVFPDEVLRRKARPVDLVDEEVRNVLDDMAETMYGGAGIGLAGPQVGISRRLVVMDVPGDEESGTPGTGLIYLVNPAIVSREGAGSNTEGCLSFPGLEIDVKRAARVSFEYLDQHGVRQSRDAEGLFAVCVQHEIDHLDGVLFVDRLGPVSRRLAMREYDKLRAKAAAEAGAEH